jgi:hypothetical protein
MNGRGRDGDGISTRIRAGGYNHDVDYAQHAVMHRKNAIRSRGFIEQNTISNQGGSNS